MRPMMERPLAVVVTWLATHNEGGPPALADGPPGVERLRVPGYGSAYALTSAPTAALKCVNETRYSLPLSL